MIMARCATAFPLLIQHQVEAEVTFRHHRLLLEARQISRTALAQHFCIELNTEGCSGSQSGSQDNEQTPADTKRVSLLIARADHLIAPTLEKQLRGPLVFDEQGKEQGMVGQGGQLYVRSDDEQSRWRVVWGEAVEEQCWTAPHQEAGAEQALLVCT